jgi:hypothetical protein
MLTVGAALRQFLTATDNVNRFANLFHDQPCYFRALSLACGATAVAVAGVAK